MKRKCHGRVTFKPYNMNQQNLPVSFDSMIPPNHLVRTVNQVIEDMSLQYILSSYKGGGASNYHPRMLLKIILYGNKAVIGKV